MSSVTGISQRIPGSPIREPLMSGDRGVVNEGDTPSISVKPSFAGEVRAYLDEGGKKLIPARDSVKVPLLRDPGGAFDPNDLAGGHTIGCGQRTAYKR